MASPSFVESAQIALNRRGGATGGASASRLPIGMGLLAAGGTSAALWAAIAFALHAALR